MTRAHLRRAVVALVPLWGLLACPPAARAAEPQPDLTFAARETADIWRNVSGGQSVGWTELNKLQISASWKATALGDPDLRIHGQIFRTNGERLTSRVGDLQTVSNIEAISATRLFEAWAEQGFGEAGKGRVSVRAGLIDLNSQFDSIDPAALFEDSSHGIAPDLSKSGRNGPSIFPVTSAAVTLTWTPTEIWTVRGGLFDGVPGDPNSPHAFAAVRLSAADGALGIVQADRKLGEDGQLSLGAWRYNRGVPALDGRGVRTDSGVYGFVEGPVPGEAGWSGWVRAGRADPGAQVVAGYFGTGVARKGPFAGRPDDRVGIALSMAILSPTARRLQGLHRAETTIEATYQFKVVNRMTLQPDIQYVIHPSSGPGIKNALVIGLRMVITPGYPWRGSATDSADPTVPPD